MGKNIYNENVYLSGDKEAMDTFLLRKERENLLHVVERLKYEDTIREYNRFLLILRDFIKSLGFDTSLENAIALSYLIHHGYLTFDKNFKNEETKDEISARYGMTILKGYGCCRNYSDMGKDILMLLDYYVKNFYCYQPNLSLPKSARLKEANHVINLVEFDGCKYGIDLYNGCALYSFKDCFTLRKISSFDDGKLRYKPYYEILTGESTLEDIKRQLEDFKNESRKSHISFLVYEHDIRAQIVEFMNKHKDLFEDFHNETKSMKENIVLSLRK